MLKRICCGPHTWQNHRLGYTHHKNDVRKGICCTVASAEVKVTAHSPTMMPSWWARMSRKLLLALTVSILVEQSPKAFVIFWNFILPSLSTIQTWEKIWRYFHFTSCSQVVMGWHILYEGMISTMIKQLPVSIVCTGAWTLLAPYKLKEAQYIFQCTGKLPYQRDVSYKSQQPLSRDQYEGCHRCSPAIAW